MKLKKIILMSSSIVGLGLLIPTAVRVNQYNTDNSPTQLSKIALSNKMKIVKPTLSNAPVKFTGINYWGTYKKPTYKNTTVQLFDVSNRPTNKPEIWLSNYPHGYDEMWIGYTPNEGYTWTDGTNNMIKVAYIVKGLPTGLKKPTTTNVPIKFSGINAYGSYSAPKYKNTTVQLFDFNNKPINKPESDLSNYPYGNDKIYVGFTPNKGYAWNDGTKQMIKVEYRVSNLIGVPKPTTSNAPITFTGVNYAGTYKVPQYAFATTQLFDFNGRPINKPESDLSNYPYGMDEIYVGYTPLKGFSWSDGSKKMIKLEYVVHGLQTGVAKPTTTNNPVTFTGFNGRGTYIKPTYKNTTVQLFKYGSQDPISKPTTNLWNYPYGNDDIWVGYTPNKGYTWNDGTNKMIKVHYLVSGLTDGTLTRPTITNAPVMFNGVSGHGSFIKPTYKNTTTQLYDLKGNPVNTPPTNLSRGDSISIGYTPNKTFAWQDGTKQMVIVKYMFGAPSLNNNQYHYVKGSSPHDHYDYYLGVGYNDIKKLVGDTYHYSYQGDQFTHNAKTAPGMVAKGAKSNGTPLLKWYFDTQGSKDYQMPNGCPRFTSAFDNEVSVGGSVAFSDNSTQNIISYSNQWNDAYRDHEGILIHFKTWYTDAAHVGFYTSVTIQTASQSLWNSTFE